MTSVDAIVTARLEWDSAVNIARAPGRDCKRLMPFLRTRLAEAGIVSVIVRGRRVVRYGRAANSWIANDPDLVPKGEVPKALDPFHYWLQIGDQWIDPTIGDLKELVGITGPWKLPDIASAPARSATADQMNRLAQGRKRGILWRV